METIVESAPLTEEAVPPKSAVPGVSGTARFSDAASAGTGEVSLAALEALLFATGEPLTAGELGELLKIPRSEVSVAVARLKERYAVAEHGLDVIEIAGGFQLGTRPEHAELIERMLRVVRRVRLSPASLETLSIIAYRQPVTRAEIEAIRGVNVDGVMKTLLERDLIRIVGKKEEVGRPLLYGTTDAFLMHFGLRSISDLPPLHEFDEIARARADRAAEAPEKDWFATTESQREALEALADAAERELADLDVKLAALKPPRVVRQTET